MTRVMCVHSYSLNSFLSHTFSHRLSCSFSLFLSRVLSLSAGNLRVHAIDMQLTPTCTHLYQRLSISMIKLAYWLLKTTRMGVSACVGMCECVYMRMFNTFSTCTILLCSCLVFFLLSSSLLFVFCLSFAVLCSQCAEHVCGV